MILKNELYLGKDEMLDNITNPNKPKKLFYRNKRLQIIPTTLFNRVRDKVKHQRSLRNQINKSNIIFFSTPFDIKSAIFLNKIQSLFKISSGDNEFYPLINQV